MKHKRSGIGVRLCCDALICVLQILFSVLLRHAGGYLLMFGTLMIFLGIAALFSYASEIFTHSIHDLAVYTRQMLPRCAHLLGISAVDVLWYRLHGAMLLWLILSLLMLLLITVVCFAIGAARTMLHDA